MPSETIFRKIGDKFKDVSDDMYSLYVKLKDVWLLGTHLRWPFFYLYLYFKGLKQLSYQADDIFREVKRWVDGLIEGTSFEDMLYWVSSQFRAIRSDPVAWVKGKITNISHDMWRLINTPHVWVFDKIESWITWFHDFRTNPIVTIRNFLTTAHPFLSTFLFYPTTYIVGKIYESIGFLRQLRDNPQKTVIDWVARLYSWVWFFLSNPVSFIVDKVKQYRADISYFFDNPIGWVKDKIKKVMGWTDYDISDMPYYVFKRILLNAMAYVTREEGLLRQVICDTIMRFM